MVVSGWTLLLLRESSRVQSLDSFSTQNPSLDLVAKKPLHFCHENEEVHALLCIIPFWLDFVAGRDILMTCF